MKIGDRVMVDTPNRFLREKLYWQPFQIVGIRGQKTSTVVKLRGLCLPTVEITGDNIESLILLKEAKDGK